MIDAADAALFVAAEEERRAAMRTVVLDEADRAVAIAERDQVLAEQPHAQWVAVGVGQLGRKQRRHPVPTQGETHRRPGSDASDQLVILTPQHRSV